MKRVRLCLTCAAMQLLIGYMLTKPALMGWEAKERIVDLVIDRPSRGA